MTNWKIQVNICKKNSFTQIGQKVQFHIRNFLLICKITFDILLNFMLMSIESVQNFPRAGKVITQRKPSKEKEDQLRPLVVSAPLPPFFKSGL